MILRAPAYVLATKGRDLGPRLSKAGGMGIGSKPSHEALQEAAAHSAGNYAAHRRSDRVFALGLFIADMHSSNRCPRNDAPHPPAWWAMPGCTIGGKKGNKAPGQSRNPRNLDKVGHGYKHREFVNACLGA